MNTNTSAVGTLYGIGVGPGSPDLITVRAVNVLHRVDVILAAASPKNDDSIALSIAKPHLPPSVEIVRLDFPMTRDKYILREAWEKNAQATAEILTSGKNAGFLTLGDPLIYSTFGYLMKTMKESFPDLPIEAISGITSFQAAAAATGTVLCEGEENLSIIAGINNEETLLQRLHETTSAVIMKTYRNAPTIYGAIKSSHRENGSVLVTRIGLAGQDIIKGISNMPEKPNYLSLILIPPTR